MTSQNSYIDHAAAKQAGFLPLFTFSLKQFWTTILLFAIILFFALPIPALMAATDAHGYLNPGSVERALNSLTENIRLVIVPIMSALAVVASCTRFGYLKNKVAVDYYHSLPVKRSRLYLTQLAVGACTLAIPYLFNLLLTMLVVAVNGCLSGEILSYLAIMSAEVLVYAAFFGALATLVGMATGLGAVHLILTAVAMFIVPVFWLLSVAFIDIFNENMWLDWYCNEELLMRMSPVLRFLIDFDPLSFGEGILMLLAAAAMFVGAYYVYTIRKSERAGTPVVFTPLGEVIKFVLVFLGTIGGGLIFYYIMDSFFWTIFGMLCGMVLVFMLTNTILQKTAKAMFRGWKALCAYAVVIAVGFTLLVTNAFGINTYVPSPAMTAKVEVNFDGAAEGMVFTDRESIEALHRIYTEGQNFYRNYPSPIWSYETFTIDIAFKPYFSLPAAKSVTIFNKSDFMEEFRTLLGSEEFAEQYGKQVAKLTEENYTLQFDLPYYVFDHARDRIIRIASDYYLNTDIGREGTDTFAYYGVDQITAAYADVNYDFFQQPFYANIWANYRRDYGRSFKLPIYADMHGVIDRWIANGIIPLDQSELIDEMTAFVDSITVYKLISTEGEASSAIVSTDHGVISSLDGPTVEVREVLDVPEENQLARTVTGKKQIREILEASTNLFGNYYDNVFTFADNVYYAEIRVKMSDIYSASYSQFEDMPESEKSQQIDNNAYETTLHIAFLAGRVPEFIPALFE